MKTNLRMRDIEHLPITIKRNYKEGLNIAYFSSTRAFYDSILCDKTCMDYLKGELGALDSDCDDQYSFDEMLEVYCRKAYEFEVSVGELPTATKLENTQTK